MLKFPFRALSRLGCCFNSTRIAFAFYVSSRNCDSSYFFVVSSRWTVATSDHFRLDVHCFLSFWIIGWNMGVFKVSSFVIIMLWGLDMIQHIQRTSESGSNIIEDDYSMTTPVSVSLKQSIIWIRTFDCRTFSSLTVWKFLPYVHWTSIYNFRRRQRQLPSGGRKDDQQDHSNLPWL